MHGIFFYLADVFINSVFIFKSRTKFDVCIALDCFNTINMLPFRAIGIIHKLIFYTIDYVPQRFPNAVMNWLYHAADKAACRFSDTIWILSPRMTRLRKASGIQHMAPTVTLPMGANLKRIRTLPISRLHRHQIAFVGMLWEKQGLQLAIKALASTIISVKDVRLMVIGDGNYRPALERLVKTLGLTKHVTFYGFVKSHAQVEKILCQSAIGIAPYMPTPENFSHYTDPGKPKLYLGCGLPVVLTDVPAIARVIASHRAGMIVNYTVASIQEKLLILLTDDKLYNTYRNNALALSDNYDTNTLIRKALARTK